MSPLSAARAVLLCALLLYAGAALAATGTLLRDETLRATPSATAAATAELSKGANVEILARQGGWLQVRAGSKTGWVRLLSVRASAASQRDVGGELAGVIGMGTRQADPGRVVSVAGVRGLSEQDLKAARFNAQELELLDRYAVSRAAAQAFAREAGLASRSIDYLPAPAQNERQSNPWGEPQW